MTSVFVQSLVTTADQYEGTIGPDRPSHLEVFIPLETSMLLSG